jgi:long-chain acyl-CoA synthetase
LKTIDELIELSVSKAPEKPALRIKVAGTWQTTTYQQLWHEVSRIGGGLRRWGLEKGDRVALLGATSPAWVASYLAILQSGGIVVPVDKELKSGELRHVLGDCGARLLMAERAYLEPLHEIGQDLSALEKIVLLQDATDLTLPLQLNQAMEDIVDTWRDLVQRHQIPVEIQQHMETQGRNLEEMLHRHAARTEMTERKQRSHTSVFNETSEGQRSFIRRFGLVPVSGFAGDGPPPPTDRNPVDTAVILYTSGTTGRAKGAMLSHANIVTNIEAAVRHLEIDERMHTLSFLPINHVFEQVAGILAPLSLGGTISIAESLKKIGQNLVEENPTHVMGVPAVYRVLLGRINRSIEDKPLSRTLFAIPFTRPLVTAKVRKALGKNITFVSGGAALDPEIAKGMAKLGFTILQGYGITETSPIISAECPKKRKFGTVGQVIPGVEVRIDNPNEEGVGEILVKGPNVMQGYYKRPKATAAAIVDGWYHTGDLGHLDKDGFLSICGRMKNLIVTPNGKNVYPEEVENELLKCPFIAEVMVYGHKLSETAEEVHAIIYPDQEALDAHVREAGKPSLSEADVEELIRHEVLAAGKRLADYKRVKRFTLRDDEFPKTTTRKIKRYVVEADILAAR